MIKGSFLELFMDLLDTYLQMGFGFQHGFRVLRRSHVKRANPQT